MKGPDKVAPDDTIGGGTAPTAYRKPNGDTPRNAGDPICLPPGTSSQQFKAFTLKLAELCGEENVTIITKSEELSKESYLEPSK